MNKQRMRRLEAVTRLRDLEHKRAEQAVQGATAKLALSAAALRQAEGRLSASTASKAKAGLHGRLDIARYEHALAQEQACADEVSEALSGHQAKQRVHSTRCAELLEANRGLKVSERRQERVASSIQHEQEHRLGDDAADSWLARSRHVQR